MRYKHLMYEETLIFCFQWIEHNFTEKKSKKKGSKRKMIQNRIIKLGSHVYNK